MNNLSLDIIKHIALFLDDKNIRQLVMTNKIMKSKFYLKKKIKF